MKTIYKHKRNDLKITSEDQCFAFVGQTRYRKIKENLFVLDEDYMEIVNFHKTRMEWLKKDITKLMNVFHTVALEECVMNGILLNPAKY